MYADLVAGSGIILVKGCIEGFDVIVKAGPCHTLYSHDAERVFITHLDSLVNIEGRMLFRKWYLTHFDIPKSGKFFPHDLIAGRDYEVWLVVGLAGFFAALNPPFPCCNATKHTGF